MEKPKKKIVYRHNKKVIADTVIEMMNFEKVLNSYLEAYNIEPVFFAFERLEGRYD